MSDDLSKISTAYVPTLIRVRLAQMTRDLAIAQAENELLRKAINFYAAGNVVDGNKNKKAANNVHYLFQDQKIDKNPGPESA